MGEYEDARRVYKQAKNGLKSADDLTPREFGLLYLYYPFVLPDLCAGSQSGGCE